MRSASIEARNSPDHDRLRGVRRGLYQPLVHVAAALMMGIVVDRIAPLPRPSGVVFWYSAGGIVCLAAWGTLFAIRNAVADRPAAWLLLLAAAMGGAAWHHARWNVFRVDEIGRCAKTGPQPVCVEVVARHAPRRLPPAPPTPLAAVAEGERSELDVALRSIRTGRRWEAASGTCRLRVDGHLLGVRAGDRLRIFAWLSLPRTARNPGEFDFRAYIRADRALVSLHAGFPDCVTVVRREAGFRIQRAIDGVRQSGDRLLRDYVGLARSGLAAAMLLGAREGLPRGATDSYMMTGTIHLLVVSGLHVGILVMGLLGALRAGLLPRAIAIVAALLFVFAYALVADARPPVVRAAVLTGLVCVAMATGRRVVAYNSLAAAALLVLAINPCDLFRTGPQLSFLSVATLISYSRRFLIGPAVDRDPLDRLIAQSRPWPVRGLRLAGFWLFNIVLATGATWLVSLPLVLTRFHIAAPIAVLISPAVWITTYVALTAGFISLLAGWLVPVVAGWFGHLCAGSLTLLERVINAAQSLPGGHSFWPGPPLWWIVGFYLALGLGIVTPRCRLPYRWSVALFAAWLTIGLIPPIMRASHRHGLDCSFVAVGHGACVVIQTPSGKTLLYDAGSLGSPHYGARTIADFLWSQGVTRIDGIVLSHADIDHYNAVPDLLQRFDVGTVFVSPVMFEPLIEPVGLDAVSELRRSLDVAGVRIREIEAGDRLATGDAGLRITVLHPPAAGVFGSDNANSIVLLLNYEGRQILLPGDLEPPGLGDVMAELPVDCDIALAPHHGSPHSDPLGLAAWCSPEWVIVSGGRPSDEGEVETVFREAGAEVLHTYESGMARFSVRSTGIRVQTWIGR